jgi:Transcriptional regulator
MSLKDHITTAATQLFSRNGIKRVSMDDVARKANVSKRTLYEFFKDKEALLMDVLEKLREPITEHYNLLERSTGTALDILLFFYEKIMERPVWLCNDFFEDIKRYPNAFQLLIDNKRKFLIKIIELLKRGEKENVFMSDVNYDIISLMAQQHLTQVEPSEIFTKYTHEEVSNTFFYIFLRGICTDTGREILEKFVLKIKYKDGFDYSNL